MQTDVVGKWFGEQKIVSAACSSVQNQTLNITYSATKSKELKLTLEHQFWETLKKILGELQENEADDYFNQVVSGCTWQWMDPERTHLSTKIPLTSQGQAKDLQKNYSSLSTLSPLD